LVLALVLCAPVYIYYSRAFLIDAMALMCCAWFLLGFVRAMDERRWRWLALATLAGTLAALIKSAILAVWLLPAAGYGAALLWRDLRAGARWPSAGKTLLWGLGTVVIPLGALRWWIAYTDPIKAAHASAWIFTSSNLTLGNWGLFNLRPLLSAELWQQLFACWELAVMSRWLIALGLLAGLALPGVRGRVVGIGGLFFLAQFLMPFAFAYQDYYFYSCVVFLDVALGFMLLGLLDSRLPRWCAWLLVLLPFAAQVTTYWQGYRKVQAVVHQGGYPFTEVLRDLTPTESVIVVVGADWAAMTPLYAHRKALMIRNGLESDSAYLSRAFDDLGGEDVSALVVFGPWRDNHGFIERIVSRFDLQTGAPTFSHSAADVYVSRAYAKSVQLRLKNNAHYPDVTMPNTILDEIPKRGRAKIPPAAREAFANITPGPFEMNSKFDVGWVQHGETAVLSVHPDWDLWVEPPPTARQIKWGFGIFAGAYRNPDASTDGVEFIVTGETPDGRSRELFRRLLDPKANLRDRADQHVVIPYVPRPGETLRFSTRPNQHDTFDWAFTIEIRVE
ncbi:MAG: hypothetical protein JWQ62_2954, partial [Lacunisphaera sp.]|nr:hypothetical protein [Lacunisphaera sp.]